MKKKEYILEFLNRYSYYFLAFLLSIGLIVLPLVTDSALGRRGFEVPKSEFLVTSTAFLAIAFICFAFLKKNLIQFFRSNEFAVGVLLTFLILLISVVTGSSLYGSYFRAAGALYWIALVCIGVVSSQVFSEKNNQFILKALVISCLIQLCIGIYQLFLGNMPVGSFGQSNFYADFLLFGIFAASFLYFEQNKNIFKFSIGLLIVFASIVMFFSGALFSCITLALALPFLFLRNSIALNPQSIYKVLFLLGITSLILVLYLYHSDSVYTFRFSIWESSFTYIAISLLNGDIIPLLLGGGPDSLLNIYAQTELLEVVDRSHNIFIDILLQFGVLGLISLAFLLYRSIKRGLNSKAKYRKENLVLLFLLLTVALVHTVSVVWFYLFVILLGAINSKPQLQE